MTRGTIYYHNIVIFSRNNLFLSFQSIIRVTLCHVTHRFSCYNSVFIEIIRAYCYYIVVERIGHLIIDFESGWISSPTNRQKNCF
jgi:hypothetical protein